MNRKLLSGIAAVLLCAPALLAGEDAPAPMIINIADRNAVSLDGQWKYLVDPYGIGYHNYRLTPFPDAESFFADKSFDDDRTKLVEYGFNRGGEMTVPGDWNTQYEKLYYYEGKVWYRTRFNASPKPDKRYFIYFGAVNHTAVVGVNGRKVARHEGGFTPFNIEVTDKLKDGENSLVVMVDNTRQKDGIPTNNCDWWNYGGITRSVKLVEVPRTFIRDYAVLMDKEIIGKTRRNRPDSHRIYGYVNLDGDAAGKAVNISIPELKLSLDVVADASGHAAFEAVAAPKLWSPDSPVLYDVRISSEEDSTSDRVGFRTIETSGDRILLNGKEIFLRGISIHEESVAPVGRITRPEQDRELLEYAKDLGCNFVRLAHYPHNEEMVRLCEEMGLLAWSEIPVYWTVSWTNEATFANARKQLEEMVTRDINRACIIIWSVANETPISPERTRFLSALIDRTREMDGTRLVSAAMEKTTIARNHYTVADLLQPVHRLVWRHLVRRLRRHGVGIPGEEAGIHLRIRCRSTLRQPRSAHGTLHRRIHGRLLRAKHQDDGGAHAGILRHVSLDPEGLPQPAPRPQRHTGRLQPQGSDLRIRTEEDGVLRPAGLVQGT